MQRRATLKKRAVGGLGLRGFIATLLAAGCGPEAVDDAGETADTATGGWWELADDSTTGLWDDTTPRGDGEDEDGEDEDGEGGEDEMAWFIEGTLDPGAAYDGFGEYVVYVRGIDECLLIFEFEDSMPLADCAKCQEAFELTFGQVQAESAENCDLGVTARSLDGMTMRVGWGGLQAYVDDGDGWQPRGEVETEGDMRFLWIPLE